MMRWWIVFVVALVFFAVCFRSVRGALPAGRPSPCVRNVTLLCGLTYESSGEPAIYAPTGKQITSEVSVRWEEWPRVLGVTCRSLYQKGFAWGRTVRLAGVCRGRGSNYIDVYDGDINPKTKYRRGVRVYLPPELIGTTFKLYAMYVVTGICPQAGRISPATEVREAAR